jgi:hypothetical protein
MYGLMECINKGARQPPTGNAVNRRGHCLIHYQPTTTSEGMEDIVCAVVRSLVHELAKAQYKYMELGVIGVQ